MMLKRLCSASLILLGCTAVALAQKPLTVPTPPAEQPGSSRGPSGPMSFDVVVTDKAGHPVHGLQQSDFTVVDDKQVTPIRGFEAHDLENQGNQEAIFLVMDDVNADFNEISIERSQIENYLRSDGGHLAIPVAIFLLTDTGLEQITSVSSDGNQLADVLHSKNGQLRELRRSAGFWGASERLDICLRAMDRFARYVGQAKGRKLAIWISPGWPIFDNPNIIIGEREQQQILRTVVSFSDELRQADVTLYSIDPLGPVDAASGRTFLWENFTKPVVKESQAQPGDLALQVLVQHTGGKVLVGSNDLTAEIRQCAQDALGWYTLAFDPQRGESRETWHSVEVRVNKPDTVVRTRNGYYAQP